MLYTESKQYLIDKLKAAGIKSKPFTTEKALEKSQESHIGAVLFERETFTRNGSKKRYRDEEGTLHKRRKIMERATTFGVIIGGYRVGITVPVDDESEKEFSYYFKRPTVPSYDRYIKTAAQGITKASKAFMLDAVIDEDAERLTKDMEENPGIAISIGNKLTEILGLTGTANLKKL